MPRLFRKSQRYSVAKNSWLARILLLDSTTIEINLQPDVTGADCLERVAQCMDIEEIDYFGLQYNSKDGYVRWVDRDKSLRKQLDKYHQDGARNANLRFYVQYYVTNVTKLEFEITKYLYFLQLKHSVLEGTLKCSNEIACKLASYALQAEFGDYDALKHSTDFLDDCILFPPSIEPASHLEMLHDKVPKLHQRHRGMSAASAELMYIKLAQQLPEYGHESLQKLELSGTTVWIGACFIGVFIKHSNGQPTVYFKWPEIIRMKVKDKNFGIETYNETVYFKMPDTSAAQYVLRMMVQQHMFYQTEYQGLDVKWIALRHSKKKSASLHDIRSHALLCRDNKKKQSTRSSLTKPERKDSKGRKFSRPLGRPAQRDSILEPLSPVSSVFSKPEEGPLVELQEIEVSLSAPPDAVGDSQRRMTPTAWQEEEKKRRNEDINTGAIAKNKRIKGLSRTGIIESIPVDVDNIDIGEPLSDQTTSTTSPSIAVTMTMNKENVTDINSVVTTGIDDRVHNGANNFTFSPLINTHQYTSSGDTSGGSQESVNLFSQSKKHIVGGSLDQIDSRTPPRSLNVRQYATEEQWEREATSGTRDQRGQRLERVLQSGRVYSEFEEIPKSKLSADLTSGSAPQKNRYKDILPYEDSRVRLNAGNNTSHTDYINASYVKFNIGGHEHLYIVSQGPLAHTCADFWQMIWEQQTHIILMLTNEMENGKEKCHRYFPDDEVNSTYVQFEQYRITKKFVEKSATTISRGLTVKHIPSGEERQITQMQYVDWPDQGVPEDPQPFINFLKEVQSLRQRYPHFPVAVHCSAGVGRCGVLVLVDMLTTSYDAGEVIDIPMSLQTLRDQRMNLVQTLGQYRFVYLAIIQYIKNARLI